MHPTQETAGRLVEKEGQGNFLVLVGAVLFVILVVWASVAVAGRTNLTGFQQPSSIIEAWLVGIALSLK